MGSSGPVILTGPSNFLVVHKGNGLGSGSREPMSTLARRALTFTYLFACHTFHVRYARYPVVNKPALLRPEVNNSGRSPAPLGAMSGTSSTSPRAQLRQLESASV